MPIPIRRPCVSPGGTRSAHGRDLCRRHGGPLLMMATLILADADTAGEVVVDTLVSACRPRARRPTRAHPRPALILFGGPSLAWTAATPGVTPTTFVDRLRDFLRVVDRPPPRAGG